MVFKLCHGRVNVTLIKRRIQVISRISVPAPRHLRSRVHEPHAHVQLAGLPGRVDPTRLRRRPAGRPPAHRPAAAYARRAGAHIERRTGREDAVKTRAVKVALWQSFLTSAGSVACGWAIRTSSADMSGSGAEADADWAKQVTRSLAWYVERESGVKACRTYGHVLRSLGPVGITLS